MSNVVIEIPVVLNLDNVIAFAQSLRFIENASGYYFDFARMAWVEPFGMLFLSNCIREFKRERQNSEFFAMNFSHLGYAAHMGFFRAFDLEFGKEPGEATGNVNYIPVTSLGTSSLKEEAVGNLEHVGETIERKSRRLAVVLTRQEQGDLVEAITYSFREIIRNTIEHSHSENVSYCAQYWPSSHQVEVCVMDTGIGVRKSLAENTLYANIESDREALLKSLLPGVSSRVRPGIRRRDDDIWANLGYGLYMTSRLCRAGGSFFICSGDKGLFLQGEDKRYYETNLKGTVLRLVLNTDEITSLSQHLRRFSEEGSKIAAKLGGLNEISTSAASLMLSRDFKNGIQ